MSRKYEDFKFTVDEEELQFRVYEPTLADQKEANKVRNEAFNDAVSSNAPLRAQLSTIMKNKGTWTDMQDKQFETLTRQINDGEKRLAEGGFSLKEAKELAFKMRQLRVERRELLVDMSKLDNNTAEGQSDNMAFNYLVSACLVYNNKDGKEEKYFKNLEDYLNNSNKPIAFTAANKLSTLMYGIGEDSEKSLAENKFLVEFGFANEKLHLINQDGKLVDQDGRLVDEDGRFIDENGNFVDVDGNPVDDKGEIKVEFKGFISDDGSVVYPKNHSIEDDKQETTVETEPDNQS